MCMFEYSTVRILFARTIDGQVILRNETSVFNLQTIQSARKMSARNRGVKKPTSEIDTSTTILRALNQLLSSHNINILQINDVHYGLLAREVGITKKEIKRVINGMQPTIKLPKKCVTQLNMNRLNMIVYISVKHPQLMINYNDTFLLVCKK